MSPETCCGLSLVGPRPFEALAAHLRRDHGLSGSQTIVELVEWTQRGDLIPLEDGTMKAWALRVRLL